jgi:hypothetical protein
VHLGALQDCTTTIKPQVNMISLDQLDAPFDLYLGNLDAQLSATFAQTEMSKLARALGVGTYATASGYKQVTFGGTLVVPTYCLAAISPTRAAALKHVVSVLFSAAPAGGFQVIFGRGAPSLYKAKWIGLGDTARAAGKQVGNLYVTLTNASGGTPTANAFSLSEFHQGPGDLWILPDGPTNAEERVTLDATTLTPDATAHVGAIHLGATAGPITLSVVPKISMIKIDQTDSPIGVFVESIEASIECELSQIGVDKLQYALGVGSYTADAAYKQLTFGGAANPIPFCVAGIAPKRSDATKAFVACLYRVMSTEGVEIKMSRKSPMTYKVKFTALSDPTRTAGKQMGIVHETI